MLNVISLGAGVQSTTMALMAAVGDLLPMPDCAIFADTGEEPRATYEHLVWLTGCDLISLPDGRVHARAGTYQSGVLPFPVHVAQAWTGHGKPGIRGPLGDEILAALRGEHASHSRPPFFLKSPGGASGGMIRRQCTSDYKIDVIQSKQREILGLRRGQRWPNEILIEQWIGISRDEATRMKPIMRRRRKQLEPHPTIRGRWPLIEVGMNRFACEQWLASHGYPIPPKSACGLCPFHSDSEWRRIKSDPADWARAVEIDRGIRNGKGVNVLRGELYLHRSLVPLGDIDFSVKPQGQANLFENECAGVCGV